MSNLPKAQAPMPPTFGPALERRYQLALRALIQSKQALGYTIISRDPLTLLRGTGPNAPGFRLQAGGLVPIRGIDISTI
jgi:hypothetical protein